MTYCFLLHERSLYPGKIKEVPVKIEWTTKDELLTLFREKYDEHIIMREDHYITEEEYQKEHDVSYYGEWLSTEMLKQMSGDNCHVAFDGYELSSTGRLCVADSYEKLVEFVRNAFFDI